MQRYLPNIFFAAAAFLCLVSCSGKGRVIPEDKLVDIYADMFVADRWLASHPAERNHADTCAFYGAIFEKYGYKVNDYKASVRHYLDDPEKYSKLIDRVTDKLAQEVRRLEKLKKISDEARAFNEKITGYEPKDNFNEYELFGQIPVSPGRDSDSLCHPVDSVKSGKLMLGASIKEMLLPDGLDKPSF